MNALIPHNVRFGSRDLEPGAARYRYQGCDLTASALAFCLGGPPRAWVARLRDQHGCVLNVLLDWPEAARRAADAAQTASAVERDDILHLACKCGAVVKSRIVAALYGAKPTCRACGTRVG